LDTTVPGWRAAGTVDVGELNLARWLNNPDRPSNITGRVRMDLALELGRRFPRGVYHFEGPHAMYMDYAADDVKAQGQITESAVLIREASGAADGAQVRTTDGSIAIASPFSFRFQGSVQRIDLRNVPRTVPVPHVESVLTFDYDVSGRFSDPFIAGRARFAPSTFLGANIGDGTIGTIDTEQSPLHYTGEGDLTGVNLHRFGAGLGAAWLQDPRYAGTMAGHFTVDGRGSDVATLALTAGGHVTHAERFKGRFSDADVTMTIDKGTLHATYAGRVAGVDPAVPFADQRWQAARTGAANVTATVHDLLIRDVTADDYDVTGSLTLSSSEVRGIPIDAGRVEATLRDGALNVTRLDASGPAIAGSGSGALAVDDD